MSQVIIGQGSSHSYLIGFAVGVQDGKQGIVPAPDELTHAVRQYLKAIKSMQLDRDQFLVGWKHGYQAWSDGIVGDTDGGI